MNCNRTYGVHILQEKHIPFVAEVYEENIDILHGNKISLSVWKQCLYENADPDEMNFIITMNGKNAAWLKINGLLSETVYISMLVVGKRYQKIGVGSFSVQFAETYARENNKSSILIRTTTDNIPAIKCYLKQGYSIKKYIRCTLNDGVKREGLEFSKDIIK